MKKAYVMGIYSLVLALVFNLLISSLPTIAQEGALDGKTFAVQMGEKGKEKGDKDELVFKDGKFESKACEQYGFGAAPYTANVSGDTTTFESETVSDTEGNMKWAGKVAGDKLEGTATWNKDGHAPVEYWFKTELEH